MAATKKRSKAHIPDHEVAIIGAGISGIGVAIALRRAGIDNVVLFERAGALGGTWRDNTYPGVGVDVPAQGYQFSFELKPDWSRIFAKGQEVLSYVQHCADHYDIRRLVQMNSDVTSRDWDEKHQRWRLRVSGQTVTARFVISATGPFVEPKSPDIPGLETFTGSIQRSADWDHSVSLAGLRVAVIGTGASAVQIVPEIAGVVQQLDVYQRTPIWVAPKPDLMTPKLLARLFRSVPASQRVVRSGTTRAMEIFLMGLALNHKRLKPVTGPATRLLRDVWYRSQVRDIRTREALTPHYDFGCKRPATSNQYLRTFNRPNVELVTEPIDCMTPIGIRTTTGTEREIDAIVLATGFRVATDPETYRERPVRGRDGFDLATYYTENRARSYESVSMPGLPNHFMIFGPYGWTGGTWHELVETASAHIVRVIAECRRRNATSVEVREEAADRWTAFAVERMSRSLWSLGQCSGSNSYYYDHHGDTTFVRPTSAREARHASRSFPLDDYEYRHERAATGAVPTSSTNENLRVGA